MDSIMTDYLVGLRFGDMQSFKNMGILPILTTMNNGPEYITLKEAFNKKLITITEVDQSGSVPELKVINASEQPVLLLDGEELIGAKQNRVLNTSILLKQYSETIIPVSCTERGRWSYTSVAFAHSETISPYHIRSEKSRSVSSSLHEGRGHSSDQSQVWAEIDRLHREAGTSSPTGAMRDVYTAKTEELEAYLPAFEPVPHQQGSLVFINGEVVGFDIVSRGAAYKTLHPQLIKSYAMDALLQNTEQAAEPSAGAATAFLQEVMKCQESRFDAVGQGYDYRFEGPKAIGSALICDEHAIHIAFFKTEDDEQDMRMSSYMQRRQFRRGSRS